MSLPILPNVAFFDSGQGGLTLWDAVVKAFPHLNTQYLGDTARCPYGNKGKERISLYTKQAVKYLNHNNANLVIVACGTASSVGMNEILEEESRIPVVGIIEGFCQSVASHFQETKSKGTVAVLGTRFTVNHGQILRTLNQFSLHSVWQKACPLFVPLVEEGVILGPIAESVAEMYLWDIPDDTAVVMLACTHYPRLVKSIGITLNARLKRPVYLKDSSGTVLISALKVESAEPVYMMDSSVFIVPFVAKFLKHNQSVTSEKEGQHLFFSTDSEVQFMQIARQFTVLPFVDVQKIELE